MGRCAERRRQRTVNPSHQKQRRFDSYSTHQNQLFLRVGEMVSRQSHKLKTPGSIPGLRNQ